MQNKPRRLPCADYHFTVWLYRQLYLDTKDIRDMRPMWSVSPLPQEKGCESAKWFISQSAGEIRDQFILKQEIKRMHLPPNSRYKRFWKLTGKMTSLELSAATANKMLTTQLSLYCSLLWHPEERRYRVEGKRKTTVEREETVAWHIVSQVMTHCLQCSMWSITVCVKTCRECSV